MLIPFKILQLCIGGFPLRNRRSVIIISFMTLLLSWKFIADFWQPTGALMVQHSQLFLDNCYFLFNGAQVICILHCFVTVLLRKNQFICSCYIERWYYLTSTFRKFVSWLIMSPFFKSSKLKKSRYRVVDLLRQIRK